MMGTGNTLELRPSLVFLGPTPDSNSFIVIIRGSAGAATQKL